MPRTRRHALKFSLLIAASASSALAEDEIVVSATRSPLPKSETGTAISVIGEADLSLRQYQFAADALADVAGLAIARNGAFGGQAALRIRGEASGRTLVLVDGVVVNDPSAPGGGFNFANLDVADIERIEVLRGPQSVLYGSEAIGGVVSITTKRGGGAPEAVFFGEGGSFTTFRGGAGVSGANDAVDYALSAYALTSNGISRADGGAEADGTNSLTASGYLGGNLADKLRVETNFRYQKARSEFDGFPPPNFTLADTDEYEKSETFLATGRAILSFGPVENIVSVGYHSIDRQNYDAGAPTFGAEGGRLSADYLARIKASDFLSFVAGAETEETHIDDGSVDDDVTANSVFALAAVKPIPRLALTIGGRRDDHETFGGKTSARATGALSIDEAGLVLRGTWGEGFAAPSLFQLNFVCCGGTAPNRNLQPEISAGWDAGFDKALGDFGTLSVTYFRQETENLIDFDFSTGAYVNIDATLRKGVETELALAPHSDIDVAIAYAFIEAMNRLTGAPLLRQPRHALSVSGDWRALPRLTLGAALRYNGEEVDAGGAIDAFTRVDFRASFAASERIELFGRVENAFNADYQDVLGYGEPGIAAFGGVRARL
ncbi:MAG: TonB-dependent receptor plug domain-containing protein [Amphiplicatus sp.]